MTNRTTRAILVIVTLIVLILAGASTVYANDKVTICHASGLAGTTKYETLTIGAPAVYGPAGHFYENGTPRAGHEQDYFGPCQTDETATPTPTEQPSETPVETPVVTPSETPRPTQSIGNPATATPQPVVRIHVPNTAMEDPRPFGVNLFGWIAGGLFLMAVLIYASTAAKRR